MPKDNRPIITLACSTCRSRTYATTKNRKNDPDRLELSKFCPRCRKHTWPGRQTVIRLTVLVIVVSAVIAAYILGADEIFTFVVNRVLLNQAIPTPAPSAP